MWSLCHTGKKKKGQNYITELKTVGGVPDLVSGVWLSNKKKN